MFRRFQKFIIDFFHFLIFIVTKIHRYLQENIQKTVEINFAKSNEFKPLRSETLKCH